jgi:hypothetical protein
MNDLPLAEDALAQLDDAALLSLADILDRQALAEAQAGEAAALDSARELERVCHALDDRGIYHRWLGGKFKQLARGLRQPS